MKIGLKETSGMKKQELQLINTKIHSIERIILTIFDIAGDGNQLENNKNFADIILSKIKVSDSR